MIFSNVLVYVARNSNCLHCQKHAFGNNWGLLIILSSFCSSFLLLITHASCKLARSKCTFICSLLSSTGKGKDTLMRITTLFQEPPCFNLIPQVSYCSVQTHFMWIWKSTWDVQHLWTLSNTDLWSRYISDHPCLRPWKMAIATRFSCTS